MKSETLIKDKFARIIAVLSITIAILSLGLGIGNFYYQHFYTSSNIKATILHTQLMATNICIDVAFSNIGNKYGIIKNATIIVSGKKKQEDSINKKTFSLLKQKDKLSLGKDIEGFPVLIKPEEMNIVKICANFDLNNYLLKGINNRNEYYPNIVVVGLQIVAIDNQGVPFTSVAMCGSIEVAGHTVWKSEYKVIDLLTESEGPGHQTKSFYFPE